MRAPLGTVRTWSDVSAISAAVDVGSDVGGVSLGADVVGSVGAGPVDDFCDCSVAACVLGAGRVV